MPCPFPLFPEQALRTDAHGAAVFADGEEPRLLKTPHGSLHAPTLHRAHLG